MAMLVVKAANMASGSETRKSSGAPKKDNGLVRKLIVGLGGSCEMANTAVVCYTCLLYTPFIGHLEPEADWHVNVGLACMYRTWNAFAKSEILQARLSFSTESDLTSECSSIHLTK